MSTVFRIPDNLYDHVPDAPWIIGRRSTAAGQVPVVPARLSRNDWLGSWKARWGINRMNFTVIPGLYAVGEPDENDPVLVTANYKMSFDRVRQVLAKIDAWILVLDTHGINVWCAAGKGTFGTSEIVKRIARTGLDKVVKHRVVIVPQLGATGVAGHEVRKRTGFKVVFGPVRAHDIPAFLKAGLKAQPEMRQVRFDFIDRIVLAPIELRAMFINKYCWVIVLLLLILHLTGVQAIAWDDIYPYLGAIIAGTVLVPAVLPWIPGRAFSVKGCWLGLLWTGLVILLEGTWLKPGGVWLTMGQLLIIPAFTAYLGLNFTGASTYTSFSGVVKETRAAMPWIKGSVLLGLIVLATGFIL